MKFSEQWLREWVSLDLTSDALATKLNYSGFEVEARTPAAPDFNQVVIGTVISAEKHPDADRLKVCQVDVGQGKPLNIVCGATNVTAGLKVPVALVGAVLPNNFTIKQSKLRGVVSEGMICSTTELGMPEQGPGTIWILPPDALVGQKLRDYLQLDDQVWDISITPNRGDCLSIKGLATEVAALTASSLTSPDITPVSPAISDTLPIKNEAFTHCPHYVGRVVRGVNMGVPTPMVIQERLRRGDVRCINPVVDILNYCMLELGQPLHAFDLAKIKGEICIRLAKDNESLSLLDGSTIKLNKDSLVIADAHVPLALAGIMGGQDSGISAATVDIFLESAYFNPPAIAHGVQTYHLHSDASYRFERGVDPFLPMMALERATQLLLDVVGGEPGPVVELQDAAYIPLIAPITVRVTRIESILGMKIPNEQIEAIFERLSFNFKVIPEGWEVIPPTKRFDMLQEVDVIEEIIRLYGYDQLPLTAPRAALQAHALQEPQVSLAELRQLLVDLGYHEVITYSFVDKKLQDLLDPSCTPKALLNPISSEMSVMRTTLWPGLIQTLLYNVYRQQTSLRLFEIGRRFVPSDEDPAIYTEQMVVSGLLMGQAAAEQWGMAKRNVDFFDLKGDLEKIFSTTLAENEFNVASVKHPALHPGQSMTIRRRDQALGLAGRLHPSVLQALDFAHPIYVFELLVEPLCQKRSPRAQEVSKFPEIRRDLAIIIDQTVPFVQIQDTIAQVGGELLRQIKLFDVYQGQGMKPHQKSVALALTIQHASRTLVDEEVNDLMDKVIAALKQRFAAELRG